MPRPCTTTTTTALLLLALATISWLVVLLGSGESKVLGRVGTAAKVGSITEGADLVLEVVELRHLILLLLLRQIHNKVLDRGGILEVGDHCNATDEGVELRLVVAELVFNKREELTLLSAVVGSVLVVGLLNCESLHEMSDFLK